MEPRHQNQPRKSTSGFGRTRFQPNRSRSVKETIILASSGNAIQRLATKYETYEEVPWHRREPGALVFLLVLLFTPITVALCIIALTGDVYRKAYDEDGNLQVWGPGNKVAAVLILLLQCFIIYAVIMISYHGGPHAPVNLVHGRSLAGEPLDPPSSGMYHALCNLQPSGAPIFLLAGLARLGRRPAARNCSESDPHATERSCSYPLGRGRNDRHDHAGTGGGVD